MTSNSQTESLSFEKALSDLEILVRKLEEGQYPLEEAIQAFQKGVELKNICEGKLKQAQLKIEEVMA